MAPAGVAVGQDLGALGVGGLVILEEAVNDDAGGVSAEKSYPVGLTVTLVQKDPVGEGNVLAEALQENHYEVGLVVGDFRVAAGGFWWCGPDSLITLAFMLVTLGEKFIKVVGLQLSAAAVGHFSFPENA